jgi:uncharacterized protein YndB with AHSA1/START domain
VIDQRIGVAAAPAEAFAYLHDPANRPAWDVMVDLCRLEADTPAAGVRVHIRGRRKAPSWVGEYTEYAPPGRSSVRLVEGVGMPFSEFVETVTVERGDGGAIVGIRLDYRVRGPLRVIEPMTFRPRLARSVSRSLARVRDHFG